MKLLVFDIDGTLSATNAVDQECFAAAMSETLGVAEIDTDWSSYPHATDTAIAAELFQRRHGRSAATHELESAKRLFETLLKRRRQAEPDAFRAVPGAREALEHLANGAGYAICLATGAWLGSAAIKLEAMALAPGAFPLASSDDGYTRQQIVKTAIDRAREHYAQDGFERVVCIGDGAWDVATARDLGFAFVGIGGESQRHQLL